MIGRTVGNFRIQKQIGEGGIARVYRAGDIRQQRRVALKMLRPELAERASAVHRFRSEARILAELDHRNIPALLDLFEDDGDHFMVMELVEGRTVASLLRTRGSFPVEQALPIFEQALAAVGHAHERGIVHRDVKASNVMVDDDGHLRLMDFGVASRVLDARNERVGTPGCMAPEQDRGEAASERADVYGLGVLLYEMLTAHLPFEAGGDGEEPLIDVPEPIEVAMLWALSKDPGERFPSTREFGQALGLLLD